LALRKALAPRGIAASEGGSKGGGGGGRGGSGRGRGAGATSGARSRTAAQGSARSFEGGSATGTSGAGADVGPRDAPRSSRPLPSGSSGPASRGGMRAPSQILSPASIVGLHHATTLPDECSRRYASADADPLGPQPVPQPLRSPEFPGEAPGALGASCGSCASCASCSTSGIQINSLRSSTNVGGGAGNAGGVVSIPAPSAERQILMQHLQKAFQRLDKEGSGVCPTGPLLRALQLILSSQASSSRSSGGWARGLRAVCEELAAKVAALQEQPGLDRELDNLTVAWEEVLELATEDIRARGAEA